MQISFSFCDLPHKRDVEEILSLGDRSTMTSNIKPVDSYMLSTVPDVAAAAAAIKLIVSAPSKTIYKTEKKIILRRLAEGGKMDALVAVIVAESIQYFSPAEEESCSAFIHAFVIEESFSELSITKSLRSRLSGPPRIFTFPLHCPLSFEWRKK